MRASGFQAAQTSVVDFWGFRPFCLVVAGLMLRGLIRAWDSCFGIFGSDCMGLGYLGNGARLCLRANKFQLRG